MRPREPAGSRIAVRAVALASVPHDGLDDSTVGANDADGVAFRISDIDVSVVRNSDAFRAREQRFGCRPAVAGVTLLSRSGKVM